MVLLDRRVYFSRRVNHFVFIWPKMLSFFDGFMFYSLNVEAFLVKKNKPAASMCTLIFVHFVDIYFTNRPVTVDQQMKTYVISTSFN